MAGERKIARRRFRWGLAGATGRVSGTDDDHQPGGHGTKGHKIVRSGLGWGLVKTVGVGVQSMNISLVEMTGGH